MKDMESSHVPGRTILSEQWLGILDLLKAAAFTIDLNGKITSCNQCAQALLGISQEEILGRQCSQVLRGVSCATSCPYLDDTTEPTETEVELLDAENRPHLVTRLSAAIYNDHQGVVGYLILIQDRLSLTEILDRIRYGEKSLKVILDNLDLAILNVNRGGYVTFFNDAAESMTGYSREQVLGKHYTKLLGPAHNQVQQIMEIVEQIGPSEATVLIEGATGTGKDQLARAIHQASQRRDRPLVKVNCAAIPLELLESEMFGYTKGAFTGATRDKPGRFQEADKGSIFLDEISDLPLSLQGKLLQVLEDREFYPLGAGEPLGICYTHQPGRNHRTQTYSTLCSGPDQSRPALSCHGVEPCSEWT